VFPIRTLILGVATMAAVSVPLTHTTVADTAPTPVAPLVAVNADDVPADVFAWAVQHGAPTSPLDGCDCVYLPAGSELGTGWVVTVSGAEPAGAN